jgi:glyoxylase-like metal-dependent hydrolase (beta-lactamase superfamily II)
MAPASTLKVGDFTITAVSDGPYRGSLDAILGVERADVERLTGVKTGEPMWLDVNSFLIQANGKLMLSDAGSGPALQPTIGKLPENLRAAGAAPEDIDILLLTHLHSDHSLGLVDDAGRALFPKAELVIHEIEAAYWLDRTVQPDDSERVRNNSAAQRRVTAPYRDRIRRVKDGEVLPGVTAMLRPGHTPGHTNWLIQSGGERLLIWGDIVHVAAVQVPRLDAALIFDSDPDLARVTRRNVFDWVADEQVTVAGAHLAFPGFGRLERSGGGFRYRAETA